MVLSGRMPEDRDLAENRQTASLTALAFSLALVVGGVFLARTLHHTAALQDCLLTGRPYCAVWVAAE